MSAIALQDTPDAATKSAVVAERKPYSKPRLTCYGSISDLSQVGVPQNSLIDGVDDR